jgi:phosphopantetheine adenylyltransferase
MAEKDTIFSSKVTNTGIFSFPDLYRFCYDWLTDEAQLKIIEEKYAEKLMGDAKNIEVIWKGLREITDYFKYEVKIAFRVLGMKKVEINQGGAKISTNKGSVEVKVSGTLIRDYQGKFEKSAIQKFLRGIYDKWIIPGRIEQYGGKLIGDCDGFLQQVKAYLDLESKK